MFGLQSMLSVCENFVQKNMLKFNVTKSMVTVFLQDLILGKVQISILVGSIYL